MLLKNDLPLVFDKNSYTELTQKQKRLLKKTKHLIVDSLSGDINFKDYLKHKYVFYAIGCFKAKMITPVNVEFGTTGIYIDSLEGSKKEFNKVGMSFYGRNLKKSTEEKFVKALKNIKFKGLCH